MHPGFYAWWRSSHRHGHCGGAHAHEGHPGHESGFREAREAFQRGLHGMHAGPHFEADPASPFGVRRPLRFLAHKLALSEAQVTAFASILDELKTERAQASVDQRRRISALADAVETASFDAIKANTAGSEHVKSAERLQSAVENALKRMHAALDDEQRKQLAYLLRTGMLSL